VYSPEDSSNGRHEPLVGGPAAQVGVRGGEEPLPRHRAEHPAERAGQQQRPGGGVHALAGDVDERYLKALAVAVRDHEVAAEGGPARRAEHHGRAPPVTELGQRALGADAVAQLDHHPVRAQPPGAELAPGVRQHVGEVGGGDDGHHEARARLVRRDVVDEPGGGDGDQDPQRPRPQQQAAAQDRQDHHAGRHPPRGHVRGDDRDGDGDQGEHDRDAAVPGHHLLPGLVGEPLRGTPDRARRAAR
jgi:hypothetical protein